MIFYVVNAYDQGVIAGSPPICLLLRDLPETMEELATLFEKEYTHPDKQNYTYNIIMHLCRLPIDPEQQYRGSVIKKSFVDQPDNSIAGMTGSMRGLTIRRFRVPGITTLTGIMAERIKADK